MKSFLSIFCILFALSANATIYEAQCSGVSGGAPLQFSPIKIDTSHPNLTEQLIGKVGSATLTLAVGEAGAAGPMDTFGIKAEDGTTTSYSVAPIINGFGYVLYGTKSKRANFNIICTLKMAN